MESGIYSITNRVNGKIYVGCATNISLRWRKHKWALYRKIHANSHLQNAWNEYGETAFKFERIELCEVNQIFIREHYWCTLLSVHDREVGYNIDPTSEIRYNKRSKETVEKLRKISIEKAESEGKISWTKIIPQIIKWIKEGKSPKEVAESIGTNKNHLKANLRKYRRKGVEIPQFPVWYDRPEVVIKREIKNSKPKKERKYHTEEERKRGYEQYRKEYSKKYYQENKEKYTEYSKEKRKKNPNSRVGEKRRYIEKLSPEELILYKERIRNSQREYRKRKILEAQIAAGISGKEMQHTTVDVEYEEVEEDESLPF